MFHHLTIALWAGDQAFNTQAFQGHFSKPAPSHPAAPTSFTMPPHKTARTTTNMYQSGSGKNEMAEINEVT
jgi:hypothetical protein